MVRMLMWMTLWTILAGVSLVVWVGVAGWLWLTRG